ncbi:MAG: hypothetical protein IT444_04395 [Phycisphaeraceae bacterium]|nr:hypothetical protein [Phycisphaeraceae bacterium]
MKIKNLTFIDKHIHKIVIGVALVLAVIVIWLYVQGQPYQVELNARMMTPTETVEEIDLATKKLDGAISKKESPLPKITVPSYTTDFKARAVRSLTGKSKLEVPLGPPGLDPRVVPTEAPVRPEYFVGTPPPATNLTTSTGFGVVAIPSEPKELVDAWHELLGGNNVRDIRYVSVAGQFDMKEWRRRLASAPEAQRMPESWWRGRLLVADVILERQALDPSTNQWGSVQRLAALPNAAFHFRNGNWGADADEAISQVRIEQDQITKPAPPPLVDDGWIAPGSSAAPQLSEEQLKRLRQLDIEINRLRERVKVLHKSGGAEPTPPLHSAMPEAAPSPLPRDRRPPGRAAAPRPDLAGGDLNKLQQDLRDRINERDAIRGIKRVADTPAGSPPAFDGRPLLGGRDAQAPVESVPEMSDRIEVWAHDVTVKPGQTYRYRLVVAVLNPLFQRREPRPEQREQYFEKLAIESAPDTETAVEFHNAWSSPVTIERESYFFVTGGNRNAQNAQVEVWRIINGAWRSQEFTVQPGDPIGKSVAIAGVNDGKPVDMTVNAVVVDIDFDAPAVGLGFNQTTTRLLYMDRQSGKMLSRTQAADKDDSLRQRLRSQAVESVAGRSE